MIQDTIDKIKEVRRRLQSSLDNAKDLVLVKHPEMTADEIVNAYGGDKVEQVINSNGKLQFDLWRNGHWIGMAEGRTLDEARQMVIDSELRGPIIMLPFYGLGTSEHTYKMLMGQS